MSLLLTKAVRQARRQERSAIPCRAIKNIFATAIVCLDRCDFASLLFHALVLILR
jgi:hypothetical protein